LASIIYPNSWATFGDHQQQFMTIYLKNGGVRHLKIPRGNYQNAKQLEKGLHFGIIRELERQLDFIGLQEAEDNPPKRSKRGADWHEAPPHPQSRPAPGQGGKQGQKPPSSSKGKQQEQQQPPSQQPTAGQQQLSSQEAGKAAADLQEYSKEIVWLRDRDEWVYALTLQDYLIKYRAEVGLKSANLQDHLKAHADEFKTLYRTREEGLRTPFSQETAAELLSVAKNIKIHFNEPLGRFEVLLADPNILEIELTEQIKYVLGFEQGGRLKNGDQAKYAPDMRGSISHLCVYLDSGVAEQIIFGNTFSSLLQLVAVEGQNGDVIQREFQHPLMHNIVAREIDAIDVEIRSLDGRFVHFDYGSVILTLVFKKMIYF
jgi:hypothetical protein